MSDKTALMGLAKEKRFGRQLDMLTAQKEGKV